MPSVSSHRILWLDALRVLACFLVCTIHSPLPGDVPSLSLSAYNYLSSPCIGLFFMISGSLLFPVRTPLIPFVRKKLQRIGIPLLVWSVIAIFVYYIYGEMDAATAVQKLFRIPFASVVGVYWFMYTILGLYIFAPLINHSLQNYSTLRYFLMLWAITLILPYLTIWQPDAWAVRGDFYHLLSSFGGYLGYMVLGYYLTHYTPTWRQFVTRWLTPSLIAAIFIPFYFLYIYSGEVRHSLLYGYLTINVAAMCCCIFIAVKLIFTTYCSATKIRGGHSICCARLSRALCDIARCSFGMYLVHIFIIHRFFWMLWREYQPDVSHALQIPLTASATFILSYLLVKLLKLIPGSKYIL